ncbi:hypothetical protein ACCX84_03820 [Pantoea trifolii]|uniref:hypothetical protein n=1 Tax=Pantoea trifolii TaxID=2968030 RepID=UPI003ED8BE4E
MIALIISFSSYADPKVNLDEVTKTVTVSGLGEVLEGCEAHQGLLTLSGIQYSDSGNTAKLLRFRNSVGETLVMPTGFEALSKNENNGVNQMLQEGIKYFVKFSACGSGGYLSLIELNRTV